MVDLHREFADQPLSHFQVLAAIAKEGSVAVRQRFLQLRVMPYLACQLDAELQVATAPPPSQPHHSEGSLRSVASGVRAFDFDRRKAFTACPLQRGSVCRGLPNVFALGRRRLIFHHRDLPLRHVSP